MTAITEKHFAIDFIFPVCLCVCICLYMHMHIIYMFVCVCIPKLVMGISHGKLSTADRMGFQVKLKLQFPKKKSAVASCE